MNNFTAWGNTSEVSVKQFEKRIGFALPVDYRKFLLENNGGSFVNEVFPLEESGQLVMLDVLYGLTNLDKSLQLDTWLTEHGDELEQGALIIGSDPGGGMLFYLTKGEEKGIYYWDHAHYLESSSTEEGNTYFIADDFDRFCKLLKPYMAQ